MRNCFCANNTRQNLFIEVAIINVEKLKENLKTRTEEELCNIVIDGAIWYCIDSLMI